MWKVWSLFLRNLYNHFRMCKWDMKVGCRKYKKRGGVSSKFRECGKKNVVAV